MAILSRREQLMELFPAAPAYRMKQVEEGIFSEAKSWEDLRGLPADMRAALTAKIPWMTVHSETVQESHKKDTFKAALTVEGGVIESVLMLNRREQWTICVSSQLGCAMRCTFCATGKMGLTRNLTEDEIVDQYRFWSAFLRDRPELPSRISNVVYMGMGEPLANYDAVKRSLQILLKQTDLGETRITVSTVGVLPRLEQILTDKEWPHVKLAVSLHSADPVTRKEIVPTSYDDFLPKLEEWTKQYLRILGNRRHHLTFEYVMLKDVNDSPRHAELLAKLVKRAGAIKVNLIPYNFTDSVYTCSTDNAIETFLKILEDEGVIATRRRTMGEDIAAACGQLIVLKQKAVSS